MTIQLYKRLIYETSLIVKNCTSTGTYFAPKCWDKMIHENLDRANEIHLKMNSFEKSQINKVYFDLLDKIKSDTHI